MGLLAGACKEGPEQVVYPFSLFLRFVKTVCGIWRAVGCGSPTGQVAGGGGLWQHRSVMVVTRTLRCCSSMWMVRRVAGWCRQRGYFGAVGCREQLRGVAGGAERCAACVCAACCICVWGTTGCVTWLEGVGTSTGCCEIGLPATTVCSREAHGGNGARVRQLRGKGHVAGKLPAAASAK